MAAHKPPDSDKSVGPEEGWRAKEGESNEEMGGPEKESPRRNVPVWSSGLMEIVESAQSKLMRQRGVTDRAGFRAAVTNGLPQESPQWLRDWPEDGATPTGDPIPMRRPLWAGTGGDRAVTSGSGPEQERRHSSYLFPQLLRAASSGSDSSEAGEVELEIQLADSSSKGALLAAGRPCSALRNSASSPSALSCTPTNPPAPERQPAARRLESVPGWPSAGLQTSAGLGHAHGQARRPLGQVATPTYEPLIPENGFKIVLMGTSGVGKTSIVRRFLYRSFDWRHQPTVEDTYFIEFPHLKSLINISVSDTSGTYQFPAMRRLAINSGDAFILVYSVDNPASFKHLEQLRQNILDERELAYAEACSSSGSSAPTTSRGSISSTCSTSQSRRQSQASISSLNNQQSAARLSQQHHHLTEPHNRLNRALSPFRHWSLASIFSSNQSVSQQHSISQQSLDKHRTMPGHSNLSSGSLYTHSSTAYSSSCSSAESSRRSSISAAEAALRTRRTRHPPMVIVANKYDLPAEKHLVNSDEMEALVVIDWNNGFVRASAALNLNIDHIFQQVLMQARQPPTLTEAIVSKRRKSLPPKLPNS